MKATEFKTIAKDAANNQLAQAFAAEKPKASLPATRSESPTREKPCFPPTDPSAAIHGEAG